MFLNSRYRVSEQSRRENNLLWDSVGYSVWTCETCSYWYRLSRQRLERNTVIRNGIDWNTIGSGMWSMEQQIAWVTLKALSAIRIHSKSNSLHTTLKTAVLSAVTFVTFSTVTIEQVLSIVMIRIHCRVRNNRRCHFVSVFTARCT